MKIFETISELDDYLAPLRTAGRSIGLVPTMGYLHAGHASLIERAKLENDVVVISIFVNPTQFAPEEDFDAYPRDLVKDVATAGDAGADCIFAPPAAAMYPDGFSTYVDVTGEETRGLCAASRPGHFRGVTTVVAKLFEIVDPDRAYFGQKDVQQLAVIRRMVKDLNMRVAVVGCPIIRDPDGVALSSRNVYLTADERAAAVVLREALDAAAELIKRGETSSDTIVTVLKRRISDEPLARLEYAELRKADSFASPARIEGDVILAVAARFGQARLIDNIVVSKEK